MRGALPGYPALLQPVAHSLLQSLEEVRRHLTGLTPEELWERPQEAASVGYHVRHAAGSLDRLLTYARAEMLSDAQLTALRAEAEPDMDTEAAARLVEQFLVVELDHRRTVDRHARVAVSAVSGDDPEQLGLPLDEAVERLLEALRISIRNGEEE